MRAIRDLKGKTVAVSDVGNPDHAFLASIFVYISLDPRRDVHWVTYPPAEAIQLLSEGKIDAFMGFPPVPQELQKADWARGAQQQCGLAVVPVFLLS